MSFSRANDRFAGPQSIYQASAPLPKPSENRSPNLRATRSVSKTPRRGGHVLQRYESSHSSADYDSTLPLYMRPTASSARKASKEDVYRRKPVVKERLNFVTGSGADSLSELPKFGENAKGGTAVMSKARHGRFSTIGSYLLSGKGEGSDDCGTGHEEHFGSTQGMVGLGMSKTDRFTGAGSYLDEIKNKGQSSYMRGHETMLHEGPHYGGTASFASGKLDKSEWLRSNTCMQDRDMSECVENRGLGNAKSDFDPTYENGSAVFKDNTQRFKDPKKEETSNSLGQAHKDFVEPESRCGVVYDNHRKHSRFSEFGGLYHGKDTKSNNNKAKSGGDLFAARLLHTVIEE